MNALVFRVGRRFALAACLAVGLGHAPSSFARNAATPTPSSKKQSTKKKTAPAEESKFQIPTGSLSLYVASSRVPETDAIYRRYFAFNDESIARSYQDQWWYHDSQMPYALTRWEHEHLSIGSLDFYGRAPYEGDVRRAFAEQVLRQRIDSGVRAYFAAPERAAIRNAAATAKRMTEMRDVNVNLKMSKDGTGGEFRFNYNVLDDTSRLEYSHHRVFAGLYHPKFMTSFTRPAELLSRLSLRVSTNLDASLPSAYVAYALTGTSVEMGLEKMLAPQVHGRFVTSQPRAESRDPASYQVLISYWF